MSAHDFSAVVRDIREAQFDERYDRLVADMVAADARMEQRNLLIRRAHAARDRRFTAEAITGFGGLDSDRVTRALADEDRPHLTPKERAEQDYQDFRELQSKEDRLL